MLKVRLGCIWSNRRLFPNSYQFMAWERSFEARVLKIRKKELKYQKLNYTIEVRAMVAISLCEYRSFPYSVDFMERYMVGLHQIVI